MADSNTVYKLLSAEIKTLSSRISKQDELITLLQGEIVRLSGGCSSGSSSGGDYRARKTYQTHPTTHTTPAGGAGAHFKTSIPLSPTTGTAPSNTRPLIKRTRPAIISDSKPTSSDGVTSLPLSDILKTDEVVTVEVGLNRNEEGVFDSFATCVTKFDGTDLIVTGCDLAHDMVGFKTSKPGEVLYRFMDLLIKNKNIKSKFACPPWKLCSVVRDGSKTTLDELRSNLGGR